MSEDNQTKTGRPTKYRREYDALVCKVIGEEGRSLTQFARDLRVTRQTVHNWAADNPSFLDALTRSQEWSQAYWEDQLIGFMTDRNVNAPLVKLYFANRFGWSDKERQEQADSEITVTLLDAKADSTRTND